MSAVATYLDGLAQGAAAPDAYQLLLAAQQLSSAWGEAEREGT